MPGWFNGPLGRNHHNTPVSPPLEIKPDTLDFGPHPLWSTFRFDLVVLNNTSQELEISAEIEDIVNFTLESVPPIVPPHASEQFTVIGHPIVTGALRTMVNVHAEAGHASVPVSLVVEALQLFPNSLDFGDVALGDSSSLSIDVFNLTDSTLTIQGLTNSPQFTGEDVHVLDPRSGSSWTVSFAPTSVGLSTGELTISIVGQHEIHTIAISGNGHTP